jgi:hypothetical protein
VMVGAVSMVRSWVISVAVSAGGCGAACGWWICGCGGSGLRSWKVTILSSAWWCGGVVKGGGVG